MYQLLDVFRGCLIGISFLIPGVSGGTMMILLGVFDDAIHSINELLHGRYYKIKSMIHMGVGIIISLLLFSSLIMFVLETYEAYTLVFFLGIVLSGLGRVYHEANITRIYLKDFIYGALGVLMVVLLSFYQGTLIDLEQTSYWMRFFWLIALGIPMAVALVLPGISTSLLLLTFGIYKITLEALSTLDLEILVPLAMGILLGTIGLTRFLEQQLREHKRRTYLIILGFVVGSLVEIIKLLIVIPLPSWIALILWFIAGILFMVGIQKMMKK